MVVYAGQGDVRRAMSLLWRTPGDGAARPGPKPNLSVDAIVAAAIEVADEKGMAALSMRAVGERLGRTGMALYTYVPSKGELVDLMYDAVLAEAHAEYDLSAGWRPALTAWADDLLDFYLRHPWVLQVSQARPVLGPNEYVVLDTLLGILFETGLEPVVLRRLVGVVFHLVRGAAQAISESRQAAGATGQPDDEWWYARSSVLTEVAGDFPGRFPMVARLAEAGAFTLEDETTPYLEQSAMETFRTGMTALLDWLERG